MSKGFVLIGDKTTHGGQVISALSLIHIWLRQYGHSDILLNDTKITTVSGKDLDMCKGVTKSDFNYGYDEDILMFIKNKKYPYGSW
ncbi:hypothetical protein AZ037_002668 [Klebsiella michiganensis]|nr:hypothetical protein [Klebsiella michiganensis]OUG41493.1 hypothetical protein AZ037_002668 [Klebsiella michiganensis]